MASTDITVSFITGIAGQRGSKWFSGAGLPLNVVGSLANDLYLDTVTGDVYQLIADTWTFSINIAGDTLIGGIYESDAAAGVGGVAIGGAYELALPNIYSMPDGVVKVRKQ